MDFYRINYTIGIRANKISFKNRYFVVKSLEGNIWFGIINGIGKRYIITKKNNYSNGFDAMGILYKKRLIVKVKPKHQSIVMRFDYLVKILQISGWGAPRLRDSHFSIEDFCKVHKIWRKCHQIYLSYHFWKKFKISFKIKLF